MPKAIFYQVPDPLQAMPKLLEKLYHDGVNCLIYSNNTALLQQINDYLWSYSDVSFLPHGMWDDNFAASQPILLSTSLNNINQATSLLVINGQFDGDYDLFESYYYFFNSDNENTAVINRGHWKNHHTLGHDLSMYRHGANGWEKIR